MSKKKNDHKFSKIELDQILNDAWLDLKVDETKLFNPLKSIPQELENEPYLYIMWLFTRSEYFSFFCKEIMNVTLLPIQALILKELWIRKFPMLIAARGFGKALGINELVRVKHGWKKIKDIEIGDNVYGSDGRLCNVIGTSGVLKNLNFYKITLSDGRQIECCEDHLWKVLKIPLCASKEQSIVISTKDMLNDYFYTKDDKPGYKYALPINKALDEEPKEYILHPYIVGALLRNGYLTQNDVTFAYSDQNVIYKINNLLPDGYLTIMRSNYSLCVITTKEGVPPFINICKSIGITCLNYGNKFIPEEYKFGSYEQKLELIKGLTNCEILDDLPSIHFHTTSIQLSKDFLDVTRSLGLHCKHSIKQSWFNNIRCTDCNRIRIYTKHRTFKYKNTLITNIEYIGKKDGCCISVDSPDKTYLTKDYIVTHNSWLLGLYSLLRMTLIPGRKIVICGSSFRQSKVVSNYMEAIWENAPLLRDMVGPGSGPKHEPDMYKFFIGESSTQALPVGCLSGNTLVTTDNGIRTIDNFSIQQYPDKLWSNGSYRNVGTFFDNGIQSVKKVTTQRGYYYIGTDNHRMKIVRDNQIIWCRTDEMKIGDSVLIDRLPKWFNPSFDCTDDQAYALGLLIADGSLSNKNTIGFATNDYELAINVKNLIDLCPLSNKTLKRDEIKDPQHWCCHSMDIVSWLKNRYNINGEFSYNKTIPTSMLSTSKKNMSAFLSGIFDGDGSLSMSGNVTLEITCLELLRQIQYILLHYGIICSICGERKRNKNWNTTYTLIISGKNVLLFERFIGFRLNRKKELLRNRLSKKKYHHSGRDYIPCGKELILNIIDKYNIDNIIIKKSLGKFYDISKGRIKRLKICTRYMVNLFLEKCDILNLQGEDIEQLRILNDNNVYYDKIKSIEDIEERQTYDLNIPENNEYLANGFFSHNSGEKIRGTRAHDLCVDEFSSLSREIFEVVMSGFLAVKSSPAESSINQSKVDLAKQLGIDTKEISDPLLKQNQLIISGTASYEFNHFAEYWKRWRKIIQSKGDPEKLSQSFNTMNEISLDLDWRDYSIIRIPYTLIPKGFLDESMIARSKATIHSGIFSMEYMSHFSKDSLGFFKRSLIESCVINSNIPIEHKSCGIVNFHPIIHGDSKLRYIYGVDPASEIDNFAIVVIELHPEHRRIVYVWTTTRKEHREKLKSSLVKDVDFYGYCVRKIRNLMKTFPCERIMIDSQGGGIAVSESLHDKDKLELGEHLIWPVIDFSKPKDTDVEPGLHLVEMVHFSSSEWVSQANHGLRKDFEDKLCLFPRFDPAIIELASIKDKYEGITYDTLEDCIMEVEELKNELSTIIIEQSSYGRDRWNTPEIRLPGNRKGRLRKDRYSALVMANMGARVLAHTTTPNYYTSEGNFVAHIKDITGKSYVGPDWFTSKMEGVYD